MDTTNPKGTPTFDQERIWGAPPTLHQRADDGAKKCLQRRHEIALLCDRLARGGMKKKERRVCKARLKFEREQLARAADSTRRWRAAAIQQG